MLLPSEKVGGVLDYFSEARCQYKTDIFNTSTVEVMSGGYYLDNKDLYIHARVKTKVQTPTNSALIIIMLNPSSIGVVAGGNFPILTANLTNVRFAGIYSNTATDIYLSIYCNDAIPSGQIIDLLGFATLK